MPVLLQDQYVQLCFSSENAETSGRASGYTVTGVHSRSLKLLWSVHYFKQEVGRAVTLALGATGRTPAVAAAQLVSTQ